MSNDSYDRRVNMFWSRIAGVYDLVENVYNGKTNRAVTDYVATLMEREDKVLECACGTGMFSVKIAPRAAELPAARHPRVGAVAAPRALEPARPPERDHVGLAGLLRPEPPDQLRHARRQHPGALSAALPPWRCSLARRAAPRLARNGSCACIACGRRA